MINVREETAKQLDLHTKALVWITSKSIKDERATINQLAQSLRVPVKKAQDIVGFLMRGVSDVTRLAHTYQIFVQGNQVPDWMREHLSGTAVASIVRTARNDNATVLQRDLHRQVLAEAYGDTFRSHLSNLYQYAGKSVFGALEVAMISVGPKEVSFPQLQQLDNPGWAVRTPINGGYGLNARHCLDNDTNVEIHFGSLTPETIASARYTVKPELTHSKYDRSDKMPEQLDFLLKQIYIVIDKMQSAGFGFVRIGRTAKVNMPNRPQRTTLLFVMNDDVGVTVRITLPWDNVVFIEV